MVPFDVYHKWLGIPPSEQPPNHYRLLGVSLFESDPEVIDAAANRQMSYVQGFANSEHAAASQAMLNELAEARLCLLDPWKRSVYDDALGRPQARSTLANQTPRQKLARIEAGPAELGLLMSQAKDAHVQSRWDVVIDTTSQVIRNDPKRVGAYLLRAEALRKQNRTDRALADLAVAIRLDPQSPHPHVIRAGIFKKQVQFDQAIGEATQAIFLDSNSSAAYAIRCECRSLIGDQEGASQDAEELFRLDPTRQLGSAHLQEPRDGKSVREVRTHLARSSRLFENASDIFADDNPVDRSLNLRKSASADDVAETLVDVSDYRPEVMQRPLPRYVPVRRIRRSSAFTVIMLCAGVGLFCWIIWYANSRAPGKHTESDSGLVESSDNPYHIGPVAGKVDDGGSRAASPVTKSHPSDAVPFGNRYFKVVWDELSWPEAEEACRRIGGRLACPEKDTQQEFLADLKGDGNVVWVGGYRNRFNQWRWLSGGTIESSRIGAYEGGFNYVAFAVHSYLNCRPRSGHVPGYQVDRVQGFICEWDTASEESGSAQPFDLTESEPVGEICRFSGHTDRVTCVSFSSDGRFAISCGEDKTVRSWNVRTGAETWVNTSCESAPIAIHIDNKFQRVSVCDRTHILTMMSDNGRLISSVVIDDGEAKSAAFSRKGDLLLTIPKQGERDVLIYDRISETVKHRFTRQWSNIGIFAADEHTILFGEYYLDRVDLWTGEQKKRYIGQLGYFGAMDVSPDGSELVTASGDLWQDNDHHVGNRAVRVWDFETGREIANLQDHEDWLWSVVFSPNGHRILSGGGGRPDDWYGHMPGADNSLRLWDVGGKRLIQKFDGHRAAVLSLAFSPDGKYALSGSADSTVRLWRMP
jgi:WD40 repeat protein/tetratricopeptide (TPR) repeat protein